ncbi:YncE family protein [Clostridium sp.]|uniref:YncE family protein n=1 Tax=Clostridium sp. TaxID=1506 RepID=UPI003F3DE63B
MKSILVCNTGSDSISKINLLDYSVESLPLRFSEKQRGPQGLYTCNDNIYVTNSYDNSVSIINSNSFKEEASIYIGPSPSDIVYIDKKLYIACSESNTIVVYDLLEDRIILEIPIDMWPQKIALDEEKSLLFVSNLLSHNISVIDIKSNTIIRNILAGENPTKIRVSNNKKMLFICESCISEESNGFIEIYSLEDYKSIKRIEVGKYPVDMWEDNESLYISNLNDGTISVINLQSLKEVKRLFIGGMPKGIVKYEECLFIADYLNGRVLVIDLKNNKIKAITVGEEPNAMTLY